MDSNHRLHTIYAVKSTNFNTLYTIYSILEYRTPNVPQNYLYIKAYFLTKSTLIRGCFYCLCPAHTFRISCIHNKCIQVHSHISRNDSYLQIFHRFYLQAIYSYYNTRLYYTLLLIKSPIQFFIIDLRMYLRVARSADGFPLAYVAER